MSHRLVNALWVFTIAFVVGLAGVLVVQNGLLPEEEMATIADSIGSVEEPKPEWMRDPLIEQTWPLHIEYQCDVRRGGRIEAAFRLTNVSSGTAYFELDHKNGKLRSFLSNAFPWSKRVLSRIEMTSLSPGDSTRLYVPVPDDAEYFELSFGVSCGKSNRTRIVYWGTHSSESAPMCAAR